MPKKRVKKNRKKAIIITCSSVFGVLLLIFGAFMIYAADYYKADEAAIKDFLYDGVIETRVLDDETLIISPENATTGFVFYPGGKVEHEAYIPLMKTLAAHGIGCVLLKMPFNLAVLDKNAADDAFEYLPTVRRWYIGGHSLGGSMAAAYAAENESKIKGVVLLSAYSTENLSDSGLSVLSVLGSSDGVLNREKYEKYKSNLPVGFKEYIIEGGNHAYFGMYGEQDGDGKAAVSNEDQIIITAEQILYFMANQ